MNHRYPRDRPAPKQREEILVACGAVAQVRKSNRFEAERFYPTKVQLVNCWCATEKLFESTSLVVAWLAKRYTRSVGYEYLVCKGVISAENSLRESDSRVSAVFVRRDAMPVSKHFAAICGGI
jgi:hypothetical protein